MWKVDNMDIKNFLYLIEVADTGSITRAAQNLYMSQPYLSKIIREIEESFMIRIFLRTSRGVELTDEGEKFINQAKILLDEYDKFQDIRNESNNSRKTFTLSTVSSSLTVESFIRLIKEYENENIEFSIKESGGILPLEDIYLLNSDLAVIYVQNSKKKDLMEDLKRKGIAYRKINTLQSSLVLRSGHPLLNRECDITIDSLVNYGLIKYDNDVLIYDNVDKNQSIYENLLNTGKITRIVNINNRALLHNLLTHTNFVSIGTSPAKNQEDLFGIVSIPFSFLNSGDHIEMGIIYLKRSALNPITERFIEILLETYG